MKQQEFTDEEIQQRFNKIPIAIRRQLEENIIVKILCCRYAVGEIHFLDEMMDQLMTSLVSKIKKLELFGPTKTLSLADVEAKRLSKQQS